MNDEASMQIHLKGGRLIDPQAGIDAKTDLFIAGGRVVAIGTMPAGFAAQRSIDAAGKIVCPGFVDLSTRLAGLETELAAAVAGGVTAVACSGMLRRL